MIDTDGMVHRVAGHRAGRRRRRRRGYAGDGGPATRRASSTTRSTSRSPTTARSTSPTSTTTASARSIRDGTISTVVGDVRRARATTATAARADAALLKRPYGIEYVDGALARRRHRQQRDPHGAAAADAAPSRLLASCSCSRAPGEGGDDRAEPVFPADYAATYIEVRDCRASGDHDLNNIRDPRRSGGARAVPGPRRCRSRSARSCSRRSTTSPTPTCAGPITQWTVMRRAPGGSSPDARLDLAARRRSSARSSAEDERALHRLPRGLRARRPTATSGPAPSRERVSAG